jgi:hypothetical protein
MRVFKTNVNLNMKQSVRLKQPTTIKDGILSTLLTFA